jgi:hypothetical protein
MTNTKAFFLALAFFMAMNIISPAQARQHHPRVGQLDPGCNVIFPCIPMAGQTARNGSPFAGARSMRISLHRTRKARHGAPHGHREASAPHATKFQDRVADAGRGMVRSVSGAVAYVAAGAQGAFQCLVSSLDDAGYKITEMGGFASGGHIRHSKHYSGLALDINQLARGRISRPFPINHIQMARSCGLTDGGTWANSDLGHFETNGPTRYASVRHHRRTRYARRRDHRYAGAG